MIKIALSAISLVLSVFIYILISWYNMQDADIMRINQNHLQSIRNLDQISQTNIWLKRYIIPTLHDIPKSSNKASLQIISFFDNNYKRYNLKIVKLNIKEKSKKTMLISYKLGLDNLALVKSFMHLKLKSGFIEFNSFKFTPQMLTGEMSLIVQSLSGDKNVSK